ncbi:MAG: GNAT family N-acetyltransferase [Chloroflexi bacterium]|nr:GNAT family N-acetyltransferase [Chloroflexota bacterium]
MITLQQGLKMRPPTMDDLQSMVDTINAYYLKRIGLATYSLEHLQSIISSPHVNLETDYRVIVNEQNETVAIMGLTTVDPFVENEIRFRIHPDYEGMGLEEMLYDWAQQRAQENIHLAPADARVVLTNWLSAKDTSGNALVEARGFAKVRDFAKMKIDLENADIPEPVFPPDITIRSYSELNDVQVLTEAINLSFRDHWGFFDEKVEEIQHWLETAPHIDTDYFFLAMDGDNIAGMSLCLMHMTEDMDAGYIDTVAVMPQYRRQGIALNLLHHSFRALKVAGRKRALLDVDADSLTGATRLYEKAGMHVDRKNYAWEKILRDGKEYRTQTLED